jgi:molecular chaperone DnaK (HSP70)
MNQQQLQLLMDYNNIYKIKIKRIFIFLIGRGTFEVTILEINNNKFNIKAIGGDSL